MFFQPLPEIDVTTLAEKLKSDEEFILLDGREADELLRAKIDDRRLVHAALSQPPARGTSMLPAPAQGDALSWQVEPVETLSKGAGGEGG